jgi:hypothetical protein
VAIGVIGWRSAEHPRPRGVGYVELRSSVEGGRVSDREPVDA